METWLLALLICAAYLVATLVMGLLPGLRVTKSVAGYVAADRTMGFVVLYFVLGTSIFSSFAFLGGPGWAYSRGAAAYYIIAYGVVRCFPSSPPATRERCSPRPGSPPAASPGPGRLSARRC